MNHQLLSLNWAKRHLRHIQMCVILNILWLHHVFTLSHRVYWPEPGSNTPVVSSLPSIWPPWAWSSLDALVPSSHQHQHLTVYLVQTDAQIANSCWSSLISLKVCSCSHFEMFLISFDFSRVSTPLRSALNEEHMKSQQPHIFLFLCCKAPVFSEKSLWSFSVNGACWWCVPCRTQWRWLTRSASRGWGRVFSSSLRLLRFLLRSSFLRILYSSNRLRSLVQGRVTGRGGTPGGTVTTEGKEAGSWGGGSERIKNRRACTLNRPLEKTQCRLEQTINQLSCVSCLFIFYWKSL